MPDTIAQSSPADKVTPLLTNDQINNAVATKMLSEVAKGGIPTTDSLGLTVNQGDYYSLSDASTDMAKLAGDPSRAGVLQAMAQKIEAHDPSLGLTHATVDRDKDGTITGFDFQSDAVQSFYNQKLNKDMSTGMTLKEASAYEARGSVDDAAAVGSRTGVFHLEAPRS